MCTHLMFVLHTSLKFAAVPQANGFGSQLLAVPNFSRVYSCNISDTGSVLNYEFKPHYFSHLLSIISLQRRAGLSNLSANTLPGQHLLLAFSYLIPDRHKET